MRKTNKVVIEAIVNEHPYKVLTDDEFSLLWQKAHKIYGFTTFSKSKLRMRLSESGIIETVFMSNEKKDTYPVYGIQRKNPDILDFAAARSRTSYFSHYTALTIHALTLQIPKHIYLAYERGTRTTGNYTISQESIDNALDKPPRQTNNSRSCKDYMIHQLNTQFNNNLGVIPFRGNLAVTDIERTLIDISVRPFYAGGVTQVIEAFVNAKNNIDTDKLLSYYQKMEFIYPYHQVIGFYMEKAGYDPEKIAPFAQMEQKFRFYLSYNIRFKEFSERWNLYYPKGL